MQRITMSPAGETVAVAAVAAVAATVPVGPPGETKLEAHRDYCSAAALLASVPLCQQSAAQLAVAPSLLAPSLAFGLVGAPKLKPKLATRHGYYRP
mmetsp:Transcript_17101/g.36209  ORF Transcript_17101/g.36209 Transcript_17101/m.36209 type:complete len:96 (-) Transcript_17101:118-405(-)